MFAAYTQLDIGTRGLAPLNRYRYQLANPLVIDADEGIAVKNSIMLIIR